MPTTDPAKLQKRVLSRLFRRRFLEELLRLHGANQLRFFGEHAGLADAGAFKTWLAPLRRCEWVVYAKLPRGFLIPTPVGDYNPDWAISFKEGKVKHIYFVAETKGSMSTMELREIEKTKIRCARKFFDEMNRRFAPDNVRYDVVDSFGKLMEVIK